MTRGESRYPPQVLEHLRRPRHAGRFPPELPGVLRASLGASADAGLVRLELRLDAGRVVDVRVQAFGCGWTIASACWLAEHTLGREPRELAGLRPELLVEALALPEDKRHCAELACNCLGRALAAAPKHA